MRVSMFSAVGAMMVAGVASGQVLPTLPHTFFNFIPFGMGTPGGVATMHQVFDASLFTGVNSGGPVEISHIAFAPSASPGTTYDLGQVTIGMGYTNAMPGVAAGSGGLEIPVEGPSGAQTSLGR